MSRYVIDAMLRPPVELWSALVSASVGIGALLAPTSLMLTPATGRIVAAALVTLAVLRTGQAWRVLRYRRRLTRLAPYRLRASALPCSTTRLFLGLGFEWQPKHTQRLRDTRRPELQRYLQPRLMYRSVRALARAWEGRPLLGQVAAFLNQPRLNPWAPRAALGGNPALHGVAGQERPVWMALDQRVGHTLVLGTTRVGKTRLAELLIAQDIRRGEAVIVIDPKGDAELLQRVCAEAHAAGRSADVLVFHLGFPKHSARYNAIGRFSRITEVATRIANQLPSAGNAAAFKEFAWRFVNIIARALVALGEPTDYGRIRRYLNDIEPLFVRYAEHVLDTSSDKHWRDAVRELTDNLSTRSVPAAMRGRQPAAIALYRYLQSRGDYEPVLDGLMSTFKYDRSYFDKIVSSVGPLLEKLCTGAVGELLSPQTMDTDTRPILDWMDAVTGGKIVYVGLDALSDTAVAGAVGNSMFADLVSVAGQLYKQQQQSHTKPLPKVCLHADEFNELIGDEFVPLLNKAGGAGFQVTAYTQTWSDVEARLGSAAKAGQVAGNFNSLIMLRVKEPATAEMLISQLPSVDVLSLMTVSAVDDSSEPGSGVDFRSRNEDRISVAEVPLIAVADLVALPKGHAFALLDGGRLFKVRVPIIDPPKHKDVPVAIASMAASMRRCYTSHPQWYRDTDQWWQPVANATTDPP